jgi:hypothetical protein
MLTIAIVVILQIHTRICYSSATLSSPDCPGINYWDTTLASGVGCIWQQRNKKNAESRTDLKREKNGETVKLPARSLHLTGEENWSAELILVRPIRGGEATEEMLRRRQQQAGNSQPSDLRITSCGRI